MEGAGLCFNVSIANAAASSTSVDIVLDPASTSTPGVDFIIEPTTMVFPGGFNGSMTVCVSSLDDQFFEPVELLRLKLANPTNNASITNGVINFGFYDNDSITTTYPCQQPFISEYIHSLSLGDGQVIEIYNPTAGNVDLSAYNLRLFYNGNADAGNIISLSGSLAPGSVYVVANAQSPPEITAQADQLTQLLNFTGDDAVGLYQGDVLVDIVGVIGQDPGFSWPAGLQYRTASNVLVRDSVIQQGETSWPISAGHWRGYDQSDFSHLGSHFMLPCGPNGLPPLLNLITTDATFDESIGGIGISVALYYPAPDETTVEIALGPASTAIPGADFQLNPTDELVFPANYTGTVGLGISITDDLSVEPAEQLVVVLRNPSNGGVLLDSVFVLTILDNDVSGASSAAGADWPLRLSPNPVEAGAELRIDLPGKELFEAHLYNAQGQKVHSEVFATSDHLWRLGIPSDLPAGHYILQLRGPDGVATRPIFVN